MKREIHILLLEDNSTDSELLEAMLRCGDFLPKLSRVETEQEFRRALETTAPDLIISDYSLPSYSGKAALILAKELRRDIPFIFYSGTIGEESAVDALKMGATDYVLKEKPKRLIAAIHRALEEVEQRNRQNEAEQKILSQAQLLDMATDAIIVKDIHGRVLFWNNGAERLYGYTRTEIEGANIGELLYQLPSQAREDAFTRTMSTGGWSGELEHLRKGGQKVIVSSRWTLVRDQEGRPERILVISTDVTEKKQLEKQFLRAQRLESVGTLASGIAHDLNNVLSPIMMSAEMLKELELPSEAVDYVQMIRTSGERGAGIVKQLLTFVRGSDGKRVSVSLPPLIREVKEVIQGTFPKSIAKTFKVDPSLAPVRADPTQLHQVFMNLCINARDAMPGGGTLSIHARNLPPSQIEIVVQDSGTGIPPDILEKVFDPFFTTKEPGKGTGLGLSTVLGIIKSHGGKLTVESEQGIGTKFTIILPTEAQKAEGISQMVRPPQGHGELVLVVDDELPIRTVLGQTLTTHGYEVLTAHDGAAALVQFTRHQAQTKVLITDMGMPGLDGASLAKTVRGIKPEVKILGTSGMMDQNLLPEADCFLPKPFSSDHLLKVLSELLEEANKSK